MNTPSLTTPLHPQPPLPLSQTNIEFLTPASTPSLCLSCSPPGGKFPAITTLSGLGSAVDNVFLGTASWTVSGRSGMGGIYVLRARSRGPQR